MPVNFKNFEYSYIGTSGKRVFVPSEHGRKIGCELKARIEEEIAFEPVFYHLAKGGHVAAMHSHRANAYFAKIDLKSFFYSIGRNRVSHVLYERGIEKAGFYAKWSSVKNPYTPPSYALPYGFVQSPILATLVLRDSALGAFVLSLPSDVTASVYLDDIALSSNDEKLLSCSFQQLLDAATTANFQLNSQKVVQPTDSIVLFNCELEYARTAVTAARRAEFYSVERSSESMSAFEDYCEVVEGELKAC
jgi:hypothetical protein